MKHCPSCLTNHPDDFNHCPRCGGVLVPLPAEPTETGGITMGDDNVIAGDLLGTQTNYYGETTINQHRDDTKRIDTCHVCGGPRPIVEGYYCRGCGKFTCREDYLPRLHRCTICADSVDAHEQASFDTIFLPPGEILSVYEHAQSAEQLSALTDTIDPASRDSSQHTIEMHLAQNPSELFGKPLFTVGGDLGSLYAYVEAGVRLHRFDAVRDVLQRISMAGGDYETFSRMRLLELDMDRSIISGTAIDPSTLPALESLSQMTVTDHRYIRLLKRYYHVACGETSLWSIASDVDTQGEQVWIARKRATIAMIGTRGAREAIGAVGEIVFQTGKTMLVSMPVKIGKIHQPELFSDTPYISRNHATLTVTIDGSVYIEDTRSKNGTAVNDRELIPHHPMILSDGDTLSLSDLTGVFHSR